MNLINDLNNAISSTSPADQSKKDGFIPPNTPAANGVGLPYSQIPYEVNGNALIKRNLIHWLIPDMGVVKMYVNPEQIQYNNTKLINKERTKGGYNLQYWGEDLTTLTISGTTGSSGIEGINVLYEIYRSEQYSFDPIGLSLSANNASVNGVDNIVNNLAGAAGSALGSLGGDSLAGVGGVIGQLAAGSAAAGSLAPTNIPSLANNAFTIEMYYAGWVFRGYFNNMNITESSDNFLIRYNIGFTVTQRRGYRVNYFPWSRTPINGGGQNSNQSDIYTTGVNPATYKGLYPKI